MDYLIPILIIIACIIWEGFFSGSEIAVTSVNKAKIKHLAQKGSKPANIICDLWSKPENLLGSTLIGTNLSLVVCSVMATSLLHRLFQENNMLRAFFGQNEALYVIILLTPFTLTLGEIIPKTLFQRNADKAILYIAFPLKIVTILFSPVIIFLSATSNLILKSVKSGKFKKIPAVTREELKLITKVREIVTDFKIEEKKMIHRIFHFGDITVKEVMVPLVRVVALKYDSTIDEAIKRFKKEGLSRIPIYKERIDNIVGIINSFDLLYTTKDKIGIEEFIRPAYYIPELKRIDDLLKEFQKQRLQIAVVVDEYGGSVGIVTLEDLLEEVVGEIEDEYDLKKHFYKLIGKNKYLIDAKMEVDEINEKLQFNLPKGDYETLGGFILSLFEKIPEVGEKIEFNKLLFEIEKADKRSIYKVIVKKTLKKANKNNSTRKK